MFSVHKQCRQEVLHSKQGKSIKVSENTDWTLLKKDGNHAKEVHFRLSNYSNLVAEEAIYHVTCMTDFRIWMPSDKKHGRPTDSNMNSSINQQFHKRN